MPALLIEQGRALVSSNNLCWRWMLFGLHACRWAELESGATTIAFTPRHQRETDALSGEVQLPGSGAGRGPVEVCFAYDDVDAAYKRAVDKGAVPVSAPEEKPWGQKSGFVRDMDGNVVRIASHVRE